MTLQILACDTSASGELRLKRITEKREVCSSNTWAKTCSPVARNQTKQSWGRPAQPSPPSPTSVATCPLQNYVDMLFSSLASQDFLCVSDFPARLRESCRLWGTIVCVKSSSFLLWEGPLKANSWLEWGNTSTLSPWAGCGQVMSPSLPHQDWDALLVEHGLEPFSSRVW